jgi:hypothetical protein
MLRRDRRQKKQREPQVLDKGPARLTPQTLDRGISLPGLRAHMHGLSSSAMLQPHQQVKNSQQANHRDGPGENHQ